MKKRTAFFAISILFIISIITFSCDTFKLKHFVDEETKSYCYFENGIKWVFFDSVTGVVDTLNLDENWNVSTKGSPTQPGQVIHSMSATGIDIDVDNSVIRIECVPLDPHDSSAESYSWAEFKGNDWDFSAFYISNNNVITNSMVDINFELLETFSTYQLEENIYYDVKKIKFGNSNYSYAYWAKNVGLIKFERYIEDSIVNNIHLKSYEIPY